MFLTVREDLVKDFCLHHNVHSGRKSTVAERSSALDLCSGVARMWVRIPAWPVAALVSLSKTLNHNCFVLRMGRKAVGPVCCVIHVKEPRTLFVKEKGLAPVFLDSRLEHPAGWICARYKSYHYYINPTCFPSRGGSRVSNFFNWHAPPPTPQFVVPMKDKSNSSGALHITVGNCIWAYHCFQIMNKPFKKSTVPNVSKSYSQNILWK